MVLNDGFVSTTNHEVQIIRVKSKEFWIENVNLIKLPIFSMERNNNRKIVQINY